jgi:hypothetical protein
MFSPHSPPYRYFYVDNSNDPFADPKVIEIWITTLLFLINGTVFVALVILYIFEATQRTKAYGRHIVKCVTDAELVAKAIRDGRKALWRHPQGIAVKKPPIKVTLSRALIPCSSLHVACVDSLQ